MSKSLSRRGEALVLECLRCESSRFLLYFLHCCAADLGFIRFARVEVPARATFCDILGLLRRYTSTDVPEAIVFAASGCSGGYPCLGTFTCVFAFTRLELPGHLAAPLSRGGLLEVADQGPRPGSVAEGLGVCRSQNNRRCVRMYTHVR